MLPLRATRCAPPRCADCRAPMPFHAADLPPMPPPLCHFRCLIAIAIADRAVTLAPCLMRRRCHLRRHGR